MFIFLAKGIESIKEGGVNMPLIIAPINKELKIIKILAEEKIKKHLASLGLIVDSHLTVLSSANGNIICKVKEGRLALDFSTATKIIVA